MDWRWSCVALCALGCGADDPAERFAADSTAPFDATVIDASRVSRAIAHGDPEPPWARHTACFEFLRGEVDCFVPCETSAACGPFEMCQAVPDAETPGLCVTDCRAQPCSEGLECDAETGVCAANSALLALGGACTEGDECCVWEVDAVAEAWVCTPVAGRPGAEGRRGGDDACERCPGHPFFWFTDGGRQLEGSCEAWRPRADDCLGDAECEAAPPRDVNQGTCRIDPDSCWSAGCECLGGTERCVPHGPQVEPPDRAPWPP
jgi:hypothetical protein